jgi:peroxiredoxin
MKLRIGIGVILIAIVFVGTLKIVSATQKKSAEAPAAAASSQEAYEKLTAEIKLLEQGAQKERSMERRMKIVEEINSMLTGFVEKYPGTAEAGDASFQLGILNQAALQKQDRAITYLNDFLASVPDAAPEKKAFAHYYLAEAYKASGDFEGAKREYRIIIDKFATVQPRMTQMAKQGIDNLEFDKKLAIGKEPIAFNVKGIKGETISPEKYKGKVLLLDFWATWCGPCKQEMPNVKRIYKKYNKKGFEIVGISLDKSRSDLDKYIEANNMSWPQFFDGKFWRNDVAVKYHVQSIPATYLIDKKGKIRYKSLRGRQLEVAVKKLLEE